MPVSQRMEEKLLEALLSKANYTATKQYIGLATMKPSELTKSVTAKVFGEKEPKETDGWVRIEVDGPEWEMVKGEGETGPTIWVNKKPIVWKPPVTKGSYTLETFALVPKSKQSEDEAADAISFFGRLTTAVSISATTTELTIPAKQLELTAE
ncbi:MAG TPA: hypothetical protein VH061_12410 [Solirubrobacteraceae bacterium]|jgi:hypothetical protein|nr:hypothetical protein [Solirubrobacteraceae bacterium]